MRSHWRAGDMSYRHTFDGRETQPAWETEEEIEDGAELVDESRHDLNIRFHEKCTYRIFQDSSSADGGQMGVTEEDDMNQSLVPKGHLEASVVSLKAPTCYRGCRSLLLRRKRN
jgi:hypothetical protein